MSQEDGAISEGSSVKSARWVQFEEANQDKKSIAVINVDEQTDVTTSKGTPTSNVKPITSKPARMMSVPPNVNGSGTVVVNLESPSGGPQNDFKNGQLIVTVLPTNSKYPWITPARFRPELVPEELMAPELSLTVEEYVAAMETLVNDVRFNAYIICYKRVLIGWIMSAFLILLTLLFSGVRGLTLFGCGIIWLILNAGAIFFCMYVKIKLVRALERAVARVNRALVPHKLLLGVDDRGRLSCHKVHLCFMYFNPKDCIKKLQSVVAAGETEPAQGDAEAERRRQEFRNRMDLPEADIVVSGASGRNVVKKQEKAERLFIRYSQRWAKDYLRHRLDWTIDESDNNDAGIGNPPRPRHLHSALCPCQYLEDYLKCKPVKDTTSCCKPMFQH
ncbi:hypothetical protein QYM36_001894 [Artemia franciscana]|uniref:Transmembrane protein n=1 Tax=Artemia franciscana TaxID=6661 RepID=A0AA88I8H8_ARTSF|nr:hypothetical protein QYM36_001894 [Artemia franciscana]KAK2723379.1 hypothetical protein QYM36_001894 [Artemia franciscana]